MVVRLETIALPEHGPLEIDIRVVANIQITSEVARRRVSVFVGHQVADLLYGEAPDLVLREDGVYWRVPVVLSSRSMGRIGPVGAIDVHIETGELSLREDTLSEIEDRAQRFALGTAL